MNLFPNTDVSLFLLSLKRKEEEDNEEILDHSCVHHWNTQLDSAALI